MIRNFITRDQLVLAHFVQKQVLFSSAWPHVVPVTVVQEIQNRLNIYNWSNMDNDPGL